MAIFLPIIIWKCLDVCVMSLLSFQIDLSFLSMQENLFFIGYPFGTKGYKLFDLGSQTIFWVPRFKFSWFYISNSVWNLYMFSSSLPFDLVLPNLNFRFSSIHDVNHLNETSLHYKIILFFHPLKSPLDSTKTRG